MSSSEFIDRDPTPEDEGWDLEEPTDTAEAETSEEIDEPEPLPEFDPRHREAFNGLLFLGRLEDSFEWAGHRFVIRTLTTDEILEIGMISRRYLGTMGDSKALQTATVAACLVTVDDQPLPVPLTSDPNDHPLTPRFNVVKRYFPPAVEAIFERYVILEAQMYEVIRAMGKA